MRIALATLLLAACTGQSDLVSNRQIIEDTGGHTIVLDNGVCLKIDRTHDEDNVTRVAPANCAQ